MRSRLNPNVKLPAPIWACLGLSVLKGVFCYSISGLSWEYSWGYLLQGGSQRFEPPCPTARSSRAERGPPPQVAQTAAPLVEALRAEGSTEI